MLSIIIPTLKEESIIDKTLSDIEKGLTLPHEIIITDGGSTDRTAEIARKYSQKVLVHSEPRRQTIAEGRNVGAASAAGEFVVFIDADVTIPHPDAFFTKILSQFEHDPHLVAVNVAIRVLPENETWADWVVCNLFNDYLWFVNEVLRIGMGAGEFQMVRKTVFDSIGGYNATLVASEDIDLFARLSKVGHVHYQKGLKVYHTGRRAHKIGWPKLLSLWILNSLSMQLRGKAFVSEWKVIR